MRTKYLALPNCVLLFLMVSSATGSEQPPSNLSSPGEVALQQIQDGTYRYVYATTNVRLYVYEKDEPGKSNCTGGCALAWPPLAAGEKDQAIGDWTVIEREGGSKQWAYKGQPVYRFYHDSANDPQGYRPADGWYFLEP
ncbi:MAG: hypothetical protein RIA65_15350 [Woeseia sp.]